MEGKSRKHEAGFIALAAAVAALAAAGAPRPAEAAVADPPEKFTMYYLEELSIEAGEELDSVETSDADCVAADMDSGSSKGKITLTALGTGDAVIAATTAAGEEIDYEVTVKNPKLDYTVTPQEAGRVRIDIKNNRNVAYRNVRLRYRIDDGSGKALAKGTKLLEVLPPKGTVGTVAYYDAAKGEADAAKSHVRVSGMEHDPGIVNEDASGEIKLTCKDMPQASVEMSPTFKIENNAGEEIGTAVYLEFTKGTGDSEVLMGTRIFATGTAGESDDLKFQVGRQPLDDLYGYDTVTAKAFAWTAGKD